MNARTPRGLNKFVFYKRRRNYSLIALCTNSSVIKDQLIQSLTEKR